MLLECCKVNYYPYTFKLEKTLRLGMAIDGIVVTYRSEGPCSNSGRGTLTLITSHLTATALFTFCFARKSLLETYENIFEGVYTQWS